jgi:putative flippase GtrA
MKGGLRTPSREVVRYVVVGVSNTLISLAVYGCLLLLGVDYVVAVAIAYAAGLANGYTLNRRWTFLAGRFSIDSLSRYAVVQLTGMGLSVALTSLFVERFGVPSLPALVLSWPPVIAVTFTATRLWAFGARTRA